MIVFPSKNGTYYVLYTNEGLLECSLEISDWNFKINVVCDSRHWVGPFLICNVSHGMQVWIYMILSFQDS